MPALKTINSINSGYITSLISNLLRKKLYRSEAQLQFDVAWQIRADLINLTDWQVLLEYLSATSVCKGKSNRLYTDIVVFNKKCNSFIPIELKYKTKAYFYNGVELLKHHGAQDLGSYDFLWDVKRIEILQSGSGSITNNNKDVINYVRDTTLNNFIRGFSVMVTNDNTYHSGNHSGYAQNFYPLNKQNFYSATQYNWIGRNPKAHFYNTWRDMPLAFAKDYNCNWSQNIPAPNPYSINFKFLILEI